MWQDLVKISNQESVEAVKSILQERIYERRCAEIGVIDVPKISGQDSVVVTIVPQEQSSEKTGEPIGVIELPKISCRESAEVVKICPSVTNF